MGNRVVLTLLTVLALAAAGCGTVRARPAGLAAAVAATAARTSRVSVAVTTGAPGMRITFTGSGAFDYAHSRGWLRLGGAGFALEERLVPPRVYVKLPGGTLGANGKPWLAVTVDGPGSAASVPLMFPGPQADPADLLASLTGASGRKNLGQATIQGAQVTHYQVSVGTAQAVSLARPADRARLRAMLSALGVRAFPADVWVDRSGLVRRIRFKVAPGAASGPGRAGSATTETVTFYDFGVPVKVTAPPASQVATFSPGARFRTSSRLSRIGRGS
jgi:hypothetical protein